MEKSNKTIWWIVGIILVLMIGGAVAYALANQTKKSSSLETTNDINSKINSDDTKTDEGDTPVSSDQTAAVTIVFTDQGFEKSSYTVKKGQTVEVKNQSNTQLQFSSDSHPTHTEETELNLAVLQPGQSSTFMPTEAGEHGFHDHIQSQFTGVLTVTE